MKLTFVRAALGCLAAANAKCNADNCERAIAGNPVISSRLADCKSLFSVTVIPTASVSTVTETAYSISGNDAYVSSLSKRTISSTPVTIIPTAAPTYASSYCTSSKGADVAMRYSSACSCPGVTHATTNSPTGTVTTTTTTIKVSSFKILAIATALSPTVQCMLPDTDSTSPNYLALKFLPTDPNDGSTVFRLSGSLLETYQGQFSQQDAGAASEWICVDYPAVIAANGWVYIHFIVDPNTPAVTAIGSDTGNSVLQVCNIGPSEPYLDLAKVAGTHEQQSGASCYPITLNDFPLP